MSEENVARKDLYEPLCMQELFKKKKERFFCYRGCLFRKKICKICVLHWNFQTQATKWLLASVALYVCGIACSVWSGAMWLQIHCRANLDALSLVDHSVATLCDAAFRLNLLCMLLNFLSFGKKGFEGVGGGGE